MTHDDPPAGRQLRAARALAGMRQAQLASEAAIPTARLVDIERGHALPTPDEATRLIQSLQWWGVVIVDGGVMPITTMEKGEMN
jgi:DNA-binding XRE family transcriptional regulator